MKNLLIITIGALLIAGGAYAGSPYLAANNLKAAAVNGDADKLEVSIDFPAVRESLKSQISAAMVQKVNSDSDLKDNPFVGLGMMMIPAIVDQAIDAYVTPEGLAALVRGSKPNDAKNTTASDNPDTKYDYEWVTSDRFRVKIANIKTQKAGPTLVFERRGIVTWKLVKIDVADSLIQE